MAEWENHWAGNQEIWAVVRLTPLGSWGKLASWSFRHVISDERFARLLRDVYAECRPLGIIYGKDASASSICMCYICSIRCA